MVSFPSHSIRQAKCLPGAQLEEIATTYRGLAEGAGAPSIRCGRRLTPSRDQSAGGDTPAAPEERAARLFRKIEYLNIIGSVSPMIGLLGTVYGMIRLFAAIREADSVVENIDLPPYIRETWARFTSKHRGDGSLRLRAPARVMN